MEHLHILYENGVKLYFCGMPATPELIGRSIATQKSFIMPDFIYDEDGNLQEIQF